MLSDKPKEEWSEWDRYWMARALAEASQGAQAGEVPVGAVLLDAQGNLLAAAANAPIATCDPSAHAEMRVLRMGAAQLGNYRLGGCTLYVTLEPCVMCFGAIVQARLTRVVFAAKDPKAGVIVSQLRLPETSPGNHRLCWQNGLMAAESAELLRDFFRQRRQ
ncbi:MAG: tRNA adenosine(34) deaminase TadA [Acidithiobacillus sp.]|nr:tRNA adenosine(34) deaminase TadA [Acidithiobacillus sp.]